MQDLEVLVNLILLQIDFTICFAVASLFVSQKGLQFSKSLYYRDSIVYMLTVVMLIVFLIDNKIEFFEAIILVCLWPLYLLMNYLFFYSEENEYSKIESLSMIEMEKNNESLDKE